MTNVTITSNLKLDLEHVEGVVVVTLMGEITGQPGESALLDLIEAEIRDGQKRFLFKCGTLTMINSSGLGLIVRCLTAIQRCGGALVICEAERRVSLGFLVPKPQGLIPFEDDCQIALEKLIHGAIPPSG